MEARITVIHRLEPLGWLTLGISASSLFIRSSLPAPPLPPPLVDWHQVTISGFSAGTTSSEITSRLGPPQSLNTEFIWRVGASPDNLLSFEEKGNEYRLCGQQLMKDDNILAERLGPYVFCSIGTVQQLLGPGDYSEPGFLRYRDDSGDKPRGHVLEIFFTDHEDGTYGISGEQVYNFSIIWHKSRDSALGEQPTVQAGKQTSPSPGAANRTSSGFPPLPH